MKTPIRKPSTDERDLQRAINELIDRSTAQQVITNSVTVAINETSNGYTLEVKPQVGGAGSTQQVWI